MRCVASHDDIVCVGQAFVCIVLVLHSQLLRLAVSFHPGAGGTWLGFLAVLLPLCTQEGSRPLYTAVTTDVSTPCSSSCLKLMKWGKYPSCTYPACQNPSWSWITAIILIAPEPIPFGSEGKR